MGAIFTNAAELQSSMGISSGELLAFYNSKADKQVSKFQDRETAAKRVFALLEGMTPEALDWSKGDEDMNQEQVAAKKKLEADKEEAKKAKAAARAEAQAKTDGEKKAIHQAKKLEIEAKEKAKAEAKALKAKEREEAKAKREAEKAARGDNKSGRASSLAGKILKATKTENARRPGSHGHRSLQIIIDAGKKGITFEDYIAKGGRNIDAKWDIDHGAATAESLDTASAAA
jgi:membrane protein involved in colicin uptake